MPNIDLPKESRELWVNGDQHAFAWLFKKRFGFFPDRDGSYLEVFHNRWHLNTNQEVDYDLMHEIYQYCDNPEAYQMPTGETLQIDLDWADMENKLNTYAANDETLDITYIGHGPKQYIHFSRSLTAEEKTALQNLIKQYINFL